MYFSTSRDVDRIQQQDRVASGRSYAESVRKDYLCRKLNNCVALRAGRARVIQGKDQGSQWMR